MNTILITGSSRGIGAAVAERFAREGWNVVINYNKHEAQAKALAQRLTMSNTLCIGCDVSDPSAVEKMFEQAKARFGSIDVVVNNAGITKEGMLIDQDIASIQQVVNVNLLGTIYTTKQALQNFGSNGGKIVNISSCQGISGASCESVYAASKAGITALSKSLAAEYQFSNVKIYDLPLGWVDTDMTAPYTVAQREEFLRENPSVKHQTAYEVAQDIYDLVTN